MRVKHYSLHTEGTYVDWINRFIWHNGKRHSKDMGIIEIEAFLTYLAVAAESADKFQAVFLNC